MEKATIPNEPDKTANNNFNSKYAIEVECVDDEDCEMDEDLSDGLDPLEDDSDGSSNAEKPDYAINNSSQDARQVEPAVSKSLSATNGSNAERSSVEGNSWKSSMLEPITELNYANKTDKQKEKEKDTDIEPFWEKALRNMAKSPSIAASEGSDTLESGSIGESSIEDLPILDLPLESRRPKVDLYTGVTGPQMYLVKGNVVTAPMILKNLPAIFGFMPVCGRPDSRADYDNFLVRKMKGHMGSYLGDKEFKKWEHYCSHFHLYNGRELRLDYSFPSQGPLPTELRQLPNKRGHGSTMCLVKKLRLRVMKDKQNHYPRRLKYRGMRLMPLSHQIEEYPKNCEEPFLEPGKDLLYRVRLYRPFSFGPKDAKPNRHSVFSHDVMLLGRQRLTALRDHIDCPNDVGTRVDLSENPDFFSDESAKRMFPSGFLFINNVFYVDKRAGCVDHTAVIREWARARDVGDFPHRDMADVRLDDLVLRLGHPEVYMHQGNCEHLFVFSEVRLLNAADPLLESHYPSHTSISQNQSVYCTTCAEFGAKWIVVGCARVPFDPAFFCETCFKLYLYDAAGKRIGSFKAYSYRATEVNFLKPGGSDEEDEK